MTQHASDTNGPEGHNGPLGSHNARAASPKRTEGAEAKSPAARRQVTALSTGGRHPAQSGLASAAAASAAVGVLAGGVLLAMEPQVPYVMSAPASTTVSPGVLQLMGGRRLLKDLPQSRAEIHGALVKGLPYAVLVNIVDQLSTLSADDVADVLGISARTLRRQRDQPEKPMPADLASKLWQFAEVLSQASDVMGGRPAAEAWLARPALGLDGARPMDLMRTLQGTELVCEFLGRLQHGVYN